MTVDQIFQEALAVFEYKTDIVQFRKVEYWQTYEEVAKQLKAIPAAMDSVELMHEIAKKNDLVQRVSAHIGTFACDSMTHVQVAEYAAEKLGLDKAYAVVAVESYLKARPASQTAYGMDSAAVKQSTGAAFLAEQLK